MVSGRLPGEEESESEEDEGSDGEGRGGGEMMVGLRCLMFDLGVYAWW